VTSSTPCEENPDQWFIDRDGRKYDDEVLLPTEQELRDELAKAQVFFEHQGGDPVDPEAILARMVDDIVKLRLVERRHARDLCHTACPVRTRCLDKAIGDPDHREQYGIWGGYFPEQRRAIERAQDARRERIAKRIAEAAGHE
jgi:hypothetical protein